MHSALDARKQPVASPAVWCALFGFAASTLACGSTHGTGTPNFDVCVLLGNTVSDGCAVNSSGPIINFANLNIGEQKTSVVSVTCDPSASTATINGVSLVDDKGENLTDPNYSLTVGVLSDTGTEQSAILPKVLLKSSGEIRAHVTFTANRAPGVIQNAYLLITSDGYTAKVPISGSIGSGCTSSQPLSNTCATATTIDALDIGKSTPVTTYIRSDPEYYVVTFNGSDQCPNYHPKVSIDNQDIQFDVLEGDCTTNLSCSVAGDAGSSQNLTQWESVCSSGVSFSLSGTTPSPFTGTTMFIKVHSASAYCVQYTITFANGA